MASCLTSLLNDKNADRPKDPTLNTAVRLFNRLHWLQAQVVVFICHSHYAPSRTGFPKIRELLGFTAGSDFAALSLIEMV